MSLTPLKFCTLNGFYLQTILCFFLNEIKMKYVDIVDAYRFKSLPTFVCGSDAIVSKGGLVVLSLSNNLDISCNYISNNFIVCKVKDGSNSEWYVIFVYVASRFQNR